jgi:hypothetical protein
MSTIIKWMSGAPLPIKRLKISALIVNLAVIDDTGADALIVPCQRGIDGWISTNTGVRIIIQPTHWRVWTAATSG